MFATAIVPLALAASALANVFITSPVASSTFPAGLPATVSWQDNGKSPSLTQFGNASFAIFVGNSIQQTLLQTIAPSMNVSAVSSFTFLPDATIGPNSNEYFIRITSLSYKDPSSPQYLAEAFSAMFSLSGMTGTFNSTVQAEINGQSTAPIGGTSMPSSGAATSTVAGTASSATGRPSVTTSSAPASTATNSTSGAGKHTTAAGLVALVATVIGASLL